MISTNPAISAAMSQGLIQSPGIKPAPTGGAEGGGFGQQLVQALKDVNAAQNEAVQKQDDLITGHKKVEVHDVMISMEKASTSMQLTLAVRNKMLDAYQEIERLQV